MNEEIIPAFKGLSEQTYHGLIQLWINNFRENLPKIWKNPNISNLPKKKGLPCICIGAGPSLARYRHLAQIAKAKWKWPILTCDRIFIPSLKHKIKPYAVCVPPNSSVIINSGVKDIQQINIGDRVLSHNGQYKEVQKIFSRSYAGSLIKIKPYGSIPITMTPNHLVLAIQTEPCKWRKTDGRPLRICTKTCLTPIERKEGPFPCKERYYLQYKSKWIKAADLKKGDLIAYPIDRTISILDKIDLLKYLSAPIIEKNGMLYLDTRPQGGGRCNKIPRLIKIDSRFMRLIGYYLAEGFSGEHMVSFVFNKDEEKYIKDVTSLTSKLFMINAKKRLKKNDKSCEIYLSSKILASFFKIFGHSAINKHIPRWIMQLDPALQANLLKTYWFGDGDTHPDTFRFSTSSPSLAWQIMQILLRNDVVPTISKEKARIHRIKGKLYHINESYTIRVSCSYLEKFCHITNLEHSFMKKRKYKQPHGYIEDNILFRPITSVSNTFYKGKVMNLHIKDDNSYTTEGLAVHNCSVDGSPRIAKFYKSKLVEQRASGVNAVFAVTVHPDVVKMWKRRIYWFVPMLDSVDQLQRRSISYVLCLISKHPGTISGVGQVGSFQWNLAAELGCSPLILVGYDFSEQVKYKEQGVYWNSFVKLFLKETGDLEKAKEKAALLYQVEKNPDFNRHYLVNPVWKGYRNQLMTHIVTSKIHTINATEGGCLHTKAIDCPNFEAMTLKKALSQYA